ncbi:hypothetical protein BDN72DRAFT_904360 [Pluteus cervinus]|uniref:Uncharacterized protein n=1 Tax=Pluteus cervinus TaxID=181527 RepID=A0ACD3A5I5_9AGAR|nr:hypothetical protein BDN72DRAFT_904360 [Pluteus cervinus]
MISSSLHSELFAQGPPLLHRLRLAECQLIWAIPLFRQTLVSLHISRPHNRIFVEDLLNLLERTPSLERLHLHNVLKPSWDATRTRTRSLPRLTKASLTEPFCAPLVHLFEGYSLIKASSIICEVNTLHDAHPLIRSICQTIGGVLPHSIRVHLPYLQSFGRSYIAITTGKRQKVTISMSHGDRAGLLSQALTALSLESLCRFAVAFVTEDIDTAWLDVLGSLTRLHTLELGNEAALHFMQSLPLSSNQFPALRELELNIEIDYEHDLIEFEVDWEIVQGSLMEMQLAEVCFTGGVWEIGEPDWQGLTDTGCRVILREWTPFTRGRF